jgi:uncharacterized protein
MRAIDVRSLVDNPGTSERVHVNEIVAGLHTELVDVSEDLPLHGELLLEGVAEGVCVSGTVAGRMVMRCARCLKEFDQDFDVRMDELFVRHAGPEDDYGLADDLCLDPEPMVRDAVVLAMPFSPLCKPDCLGLCERCGGDRNLGECTCSEPPTDPRWSGLEGLVQ